MTIKLNSRELYRKLKMVGRVVPQKTSVAAAENFLFDVNENGLSITGTDVAGSIRVKNIALIATSGVEVKFMINARLFLQALAEIPDQPIEIIYDENNLRVNYDKGHFDVPAFKHETFPVIFTNEEYKTMEIESKKIIDGISQVIGCVASDELRPVMNGVYFDAEGEKLTLVATNGHILATCELPLENEMNFGAIIPEKSAKIMIEMLKECSGEDKITLNFSDKNIVVNTPEHEFIYRLIDGKYPNYKAVIPVNNNVIEVNTKQLIASIKRVSIFANKNTMTAVFEVTPVGLSISASDMDYAVSAKEEIPVSADFQLIIGLNATFSLLLLESLTAAECKLSFSEPNRAIIIKPTNIPNITLLQMPIQLN